jgi:hypothetical protein
LHLSSTALVGCCSIAYVLSLWLSKRFYEASAVICPNSTVINRVFWGIISVNHKKETKRLKIAFLVGENGVVIESFAYRPTTTVLFIFHIDCMVSAQNIRTSTLSFLPVYWPLGVSFGTENMSWVWIPRRTCACVCFFLSQLCLAHRCNIHPLIQNISLFIPLNNYQDYANSKNSEVKVLLSNLILMFKWTFASVLLNTHRIENLFIQRHVVTRHIRTCRLCRQLDSCAGFHRPQYFGVEMNVEVK